MGKPSRRTSAAGRPRCSSAGARHWNAGLRASMAARPARFPGTQAATTNTATGTSSRTGDESSRAGTSELFHVLLLFFCVFPIYDTLSSSRGVIRQETVEGQKGALIRPHMYHPAKFPASVQPGPPFQRITARASGPGGTALRPCASSRVIYIPVTQTRLTSARKPTKRLFASARPHLTV